MEKKKFLYLVNNILQTWSETPAAWTTRAFRSWTRCQFRRLRAWSRRSSCGPAGRGRQPLWWGGCPFGPGSPCAPCCRPRTRRRAEAFAGCCGWGRGRRGPSFRSCFGFCSWWGRSLWRVGSRRVSRLSRRVAWGSDMTCPSSWGRALFLFWLWKWFLRKYKSWLDDKQT